jgi:hypothetical protein
MRSEIKKKRMFLPLIFHYHLTIKYFVVTIDTYILYTKLRKEQIKNGIFRSNQYKVNTYHYINYQDYGCSLNSNSEEKKFKRYIQMIQILTEV